MADGGAPTGKWPTTPAQLSGPADSVDMTSAGAALVVRRPDLPEVEIPLEHLEFVIGRQESDVDLALDDDMVSKRHARITLDARGYFRLQDLDSRNGITYGGRPVRRLNLLDGDTFVIGRTTFVFKAPMPRLQKQPDAPKPEDSVFVAVPEPQASVVVESPSKVGPQAEEKKP